MRKRRLTFVLGTWAVLVGTGFAVLMSYSNRPGRPAQARENWPADSSLPRETSLANLVMFAHPQCPCSDASVGELERLAPGLRGRVKVTIAFFRPANRSEAWVRSGLWRMASGIPETRVISDIDGREAHKFGAKTSGQVFLYAPDGHLVFRGGITPARGHRGDNAGRDAILAYVEKGEESLPETSVFGCSLFEPERAVAGKE